MTDIETTAIWRAANMMIELYGEDAMVRAAMRADVLLEQGDTEGFFVWKRIVRAIDDLSQATRRPCAAGATAIAQGPSRSSDCELPASGTVLCRQFSWNAYERPGMLAKTDQLIISDRMEKRARRWKIRLSKRGWEETRGAPPMMNRPARSPRFAMIHCLRNSAVNHSFTHPASTTPLCLWKTARLRTDRNKSR